jgi:hypothetical protein
MAIKKYIKIKGLYVGLYRDHISKPVLFGRRLVEPAWIELWFKATENQWDDMLWEQISDENKDWFSYCYHISEQPVNRYLEVAVSKKFKKVQQRLVLLEGMIMAGNINKELIDEVNEILDSLVKSQQLPQKQASRMKKRIERTYQSIKNTINTPY